MFPIYNLMEFELMIVKFAVIDVIRITIFVRPVRLWFKSFIIIDAVKFGTNSLQKPGQAHNMQ